MYSLFQKILIVYIRSSDNENYELMYPVNTKQDYYALKSEMYGE